ncbi:MAG: rhodanese-like domain-containing protein [Burkholderiales bacterium]
MNASGITVNELQQALQSAHPPRLIDVRRAAVFEQATSLITGAHWNDPALVDTWGTSLPNSGAVVVYCVHGHEVSRNCASSLQTLGLDVRFLEGGIEAWGLAGGGLAPKR